MNICVYGAGAIGGSIAARLAASGENVSVIARGAHAAAIRERGLTVLAGDARVEAQVRCTADPAELGRQDLVVVTVKGQQLPAIAAPLGRMLEAGAHAVFAMNGILWWFADGLPLTLPPAFAEALDPGGALRRRIPPERVIGAVVNSSNEVIEPGVNKPTRPSLLQDFELGREPELSGSILAVEAFAQALDVEAPRIALVATLLRLKAASLRAAGAARATVAR